MNTGTSGSVSVISSADSTSIVATQRDDRERDDRREHELRQVAGEVALERVDALTAAAATSPASVPSTAIGCASRRRSTSSSRSSESTSAAARRPATSIPQPSAPRTANASASSDELGAQRRERGAVGRAGDDPPEQHGGGDDRHDRRHAQRRVERQQRPHRPRTADEPPVERRHVPQLGERRSRTRNTWYVQPW